MSLPTLRLFDGYKHTSPDVQDAVRKLQAALAGAGYPVQADGAFGPGTDAAVRAFQKKKKLTADGVVGPVTWARLLEKDPPKVGAIATTYDSRDTFLLKQNDVATGYRDFIEESAGEFKLPPSVIVGLGSRESAWGLMLHPPGPGGTGDAHPRAPKAKLRDGTLPPDGGGFGRGLLQIDFDSHAFARTGAWADPAANIDYGCGVLADNVKFLTRKTKLRGGDLLRASLAAYNCGAGNVLRALADLHDVDFYTAGRDYSRDVMNRAGFFQKLGWK